MKRFKIYIWSAVILALLAGAGAGIYLYASSDNSAVVLWAVDDTALHTVAVSSEGKVPTREQPVYIEAQVERLYGLHIGTPVKVRYKIVAQNSVKVRFDTLMRGVISRRPSTWRLLGKPQIVSETSENGFTTHVVELIVAVWEPPVLPEPKIEAAEVPASVPGSVPASADNAPQPRVVAELWPLSVEILVSTEKMENGAPKWDYINTPEVKFGFASLVEPGATELDYGPIGLVADYNNRVGVALYAFGVVSGACGVLYLLLLMVRGLKQWRQPMVTPASVTTYRQAVAEAETARVTKSHLEQVRVAVRDFLGGATLPNDQLIVRWADHPLSERITDMLGMLDDAVGLGRLSGYEEECVTKVMDLLLLEKINEQAHPGVIAQLSTWFKRRWCKIVQKWRKQ
jgi:hypothetical protein